jgi:hypothetical protein
MASKDKGRVGLEDYQEHRYGTCQSTISTALLFIVRKATMGTAKKWGCISICIIYLVHALNRISAEEVIA